MERNQFPDNSSDKVKNRRGLLYAAALVAVFFAIFGVVQCGDSSEYTMNPERFNVRVILPIIGVVVAVVAFFWIRQNKK